MQSLLENPNTVLIYLYLMHGCRPNSTAVPYIGLHVQLHVGTEVRSVELKIEGTATATLPAGL